MGDLAGSAGTVLRVLITAMSSQVHVAFKATGREGIGGRTTAWWDIEWLDVPMSVPRLLLRPPLATTVACGAVRVTAANVQRCPVGHACRWVSDPYEDQGATLMCEGCRTTPDGEREVLHCFTCKYDLCAQCATPQSALHRTAAAVQSLSTFVRVGEVADPWLPLLAEKLEHADAFAATKVAIRRCVTSQGRAALHFCVYGDAARVLQMLEGQIFCTIHEDSVTVGGGRLSNPVASIDRGIHRAIEKVFNCAVVCPPDHPDVHDGTVAVLGERSARLAAAGKVVWYASSWRVVVRLLPFERSVVQRKIAEIREKAKCHVALEGSAIGKLIGLPNAVKAAEIAIATLLDTHRKATQRQRVEKAIASVAAELCEVRVALPVGRALKTVLSQLHEPTQQRGQPANALTRATQARVHQITRNHEAEKRTRGMRRQVHEELIALQDAAAAEVKGIFPNYAFDTAKALAIPQNIAGTQAFRLGDSVVRGPDWEWGDQDGGNGQVGQVHDFPVPQDMRGGGLLDGWVTVEWPNRSRFNYRVGWEQDVTHTHAVQVGAVAEADEAEERPVLDSDAALAAQLLRHKQRYFTLYNAVGTLETRHLLVVALMEDGCDDAEAGTRRDQLQQQLHQTTRDKAQVEHDAEQADRAIQKELEQVRYTLNALGGAGDVPEGAGECECDGEEACASPPSGAEMPRAASVLLQHLEDLRSLRSRMTRQTHSVTMRLVDRSARLRRQLAEEIKRQKFSGWDIILSIMQDTGALIEYKAGADKLELKGAEPAVAAAKARLQSLAARDLYAWSRVAAELVLPEAAFRQLAQLHELMARVVEQLSGAERLTLNPATRAVQIEGTRPQIDAALAALQSRLGITTVDERSGAAAIRAPDEVVVRWQTDAKEGDMGGQLVGGQGELAEDAMCEVCGAELTKENTLDLLCGHRGSCVDCLRQWVDMQIGERRPAGCTTQQCGHALTTGEYRRLVQMTGAEGAVDYEVFLARERLRPQSRQCGFCSDGFALRGVEGDLLPVACLDCGEMICPNAACAEPAHYFLDCREAVVQRRAMLKRRLGRMQEAGDEAVAGIEAHLSSLEDISRTHEALHSEMHAGGSTRPCPSCGALVSRTGGCNSMTCTCGQKFCHQCLQTRCELVEVPGVKTACDPAGLEDRISTVLATHRGSSIYEGCTYCSVCDRYPIPKGMKVYACSQCVNYYVCDECEASGAADTAHPASHLLVELSQIPEVEALVTDPPACGPNYDLDWDAILRQSGTLTASALFESTSPARDRADDEGKVAVSIEPITPLSVVMAREPLTEAFDPEVPLPFDALAQLARGGIVVPMQ
eukprot:TRINITY_DN15351_c0_g1_i1.p1 TRINITY_DN15351_c0_g1~~TRINITY_DN15351_c0_g1_i1.p1  ORF type:complete len:1519 (+),score=538.87 TRINITY_DN15351_c0_g1_i1:592-4557(+)